MPKEPKNSYIPDKNKFIYQTQSPKKTHCTKIINYNNPTPKILTAKTENHWTNQKDHPNWGYFIFITNQITFFAQAFSTTRVWQHWDQLQKNQFLLKELVNNSTNLIYKTEEEIKILNESVTKSYQNNSQKGKTIQV